MFEENCLYQDDTEIPVLSSDTKTAVTAVIGSLGSVSEVEDCDQFEIPFDSQKLNQYKTNCNAALDYTVGLESCFYIYLGLLEHN